MGKVMICHIKIIRYYTVRILFFLPLVSMATSSYAADAATKKTTCLASKRLVISDLNTSTSKEKLFRILGEPLKITESTDSDEGCKYKVYSYHYKHMIVDIARDEIDKVIVTSK